MVQRSEISDLLRDCVEALNQERPPDDRLVVSESTPLIGDESPLDSAEFVAFTIDLAARLSSTYGKEVPLEIGNGSEGPLSNIGTLTDYLVAQLSS